MSYMLQLCISPDDVSYYMTMMTLLQDDDVVLLHDDDDIIARDIFDAYSSTRTR
jgi:hypothetical protein